jgi:hypothetical protein
MFLGFLWTIGNLPERMFGVANYLVDLIYRFDHRHLGPFYNLRAQRKQCQSPGRIHCAVSPYDLSFFGLADSLMRSRKNSAPTSYNNQ